MRLESKLSDEYNGTNSLDEALGSPGKNNWTNLKGKTEEDMFINFVNKDGNRYASNPKYESMVLNIYNRINNETKLKKLLKDYRRYKMILG